MKQLSENEKNSRKRKALFGAVMVAPFVAGVYEGIMASQGMDVDPMIEFGPSGLEAVVAGVMGAAFSSGKDNITDGKNSLLNTLGFGVGVAGGVGTAAYVAQKITKFVTYGALSSFYN